MLVDNGSTTPIGRGGASAVALAISGLAADDNGTLTFSDGTHSVTVTIANGQVVAGENNTTTTVNLSTLSDDTSITSEPVGFRCGRQLVLGHRQRGNARPGSERASERAGRQRVERAPIGRGGASAVALAISGLAADDNGTLTFSDGTHSVTVTIAHGQVVAGENNTTTTVNLSTLSDDTSITSSLLGFRCGRQLVLGHRQRGDAGPGSRASRPG